MINLSLSRTTKDLVAPTNTRADLVILGFCMAKVVKIGLNSNGLAVNAAKQMR